MDVFRILVAMLFAVSAFGAGLFESPIDRANRERDERAWAEAAAEQAKDNVEGSKQIAEARARFWATYPDKPGAEVARQRFANLLREKDAYYLAVVLSGGLLELTGGRVQVDGGIRQSAAPEFQEWVEAARKHLRGGDMMQLVQSFFAAIDAAPKEHKAYVLERDWWEFDQVHRIPAGFDKPETYGVYLYYRYAKLPEEAGSASYNTMVELLGKQLVQDAAKKVMDAPKTEMGMLAVTAPRPVQRGPGGSEVDDDTVPMPEGVIGVYSNPLVAMEILATQGDDRRYLLSVLKSEYHRTNIGRFGVSNKWGFAAAVYDRLLIAFSEKDVLEAARLVRTAKKRMTSGDLMDPKGIGATRGVPFATFQDLLARKNPRGYVRAALIFNSNENPNTAAEVDAAYKKLVATSNENAVLEAARKMAAERPNLVLGGELVMLKKVLDGSLTFEKPPAPETLVDFPQYLAWKKFAPGAKVAYADRIWQPGRAGSDRLVPEVQYHHAYLLRPINDEQAQLWRTESAYDRYGAQKPARDAEITYPAKYAQPAKPAPAATVVTSNAGLGAERTSAPIESGEETIEINGKRLATRWQSASYHYDADPLLKGCSLIVKVWTAMRCQPG